MSDKKKLPRSDFSKSVGEEVTLFLTDLDDLKSLELPLDGNKLSGRLVGVDRPGVWLEPKKWYDSAMESNESVQHLFLKWDNVLGLTRKIDKDKFEDKKEYRGLRPRQ